MLAASKLACQADLDRSRSSPPYLGADEEHDKISSLTSTLGCYYFNSWLLLQLFGCYYFNYLVVINFLLDDGA